MDKLTPKMFRPEKKRDMISRTFHLESEQLHPIKNTAKQMGISQSELVRRAITYFIGRYHKQVKHPAGEKPPNG